MKRIHKILAFTSLSVILFAACKKDDHTPVLTEKEKLLIGTSATGKIWKLQSLTIPKPGDASDSSIKKPCADSTAISFETNKTYQLASGSKIACDSVAVPYGTGSWQLTTGGDSLLIKGKRNLVWKLETLNANMLKATFLDSIAPDKKWTKTIIFK